MDNAVTHEYYTLLIGIVNQLLSEGFTSSIDTGWTRIIEYNFEYCYTDAVLHYQRWVP